MTLPAFPWGISLEQEVALRQRARDAGCEALLQELDYARGLANTTARAWLQRRDAWVPPGEHGLRLLP